MVFAMWMARPGFNDPEIELALDSARDRGVDRLEEIAAREARSMRLHYDLVLTYLRDNLHFHLGSGERRGLNEYFARAAELGLISPAIELRFDDCRTENR